MALPSFTVVMASPLDPLPQHASTAAPASFSRAGAAWLHRGKRARSRRGKVEGFDRMASEYARGRALRHRNISQHLNIVGFFRLIYGFFSFSGL